MGYNITIGNAIVETDKDYFPELDARWRVKGEHHDNAPAFGEPTDYTNARWPSYSGWADFVDSTGLREWHNEKFERHPGCVGLTKEDVEIVADALKDYVPKDEDDWNKNRLIWLDYWVRWAVENCETPAIENS